MRYRLRDLDLDDKMCHQISLHIFEKIYPKEIISEELSRHQGWEQRERRLSMLTIVQLLLAAALWTRLALPRVLEKLGRPLHLLGLSLETLRISASAISYRREQLGSAVLEGLFTRCCRPLSSPQTPGAYRFGRRLVALDATIQEVADSEANAAAFARPSNQYGVGPFPQIRLLLLTECGSHAPIAAVLDTSQSAERRLAFLVTDALESDMLVLHDAQFPGFAFWQAIRTRGAHVLCMLPSHHLTRSVRQLSDGSYLARYHPNVAQRRAGLAPLLVRILTYRITDPRLGEQEKLYRLGTTLLDPHSASALELIDCYHERWEVEVCFDEIKTHQRLQQGVLRSRTPSGVRQEVYALLLTYYAIRAWMHQAAARASLDPDRLSFTDAVFVLSETTRELALVERSEHQLLYWAMLERLGASTLPERRLRVNPRLLKKFYRKYKRKPAGLPPPSPFSPEDQFLDFVVLLI